MNQPLTSLFSVDELGLGGSGIARLNLLLNSIRMEAAAAAAEVEVEDDAEVDKSAEAEDEAEASIEKLHYGFNLLERHLIPTLQPADTEDKTLLK